MMGLSESLAGLGFTACRYSTLRPAHASGPRCEHLSATFSVFLNTDLLTFLPWWPYLFLFM